MGESDCHSFVYLQLGFDFTFFTMFGSHASGQEASLVVDILYGSIQ